MASKPSDGFEAIRKAVVSQIGVKLTVKSAHV